MKSVTIYGAGVAGLQLAQALAGDAKVRVVSPIDYFEVPMAMPRLLVEPKFAGRAIVPLSELRGELEFVHGRLSAFGLDGGKVELHNGEHTLIDSDISVFATGSRYASRVTRALSGSVADRVSEVTQYNTQIEVSQSILIVGGGPIGIELAGEISQDYPNASITVVESSDTLLKGTSRKVASRAQSILESRGVTFLTNERIATPAFGTEPAGGVAVTESGQEISFDLIFWAAGGRPNTEYLQPEFLNEFGQITVDQHLQVKGLPGVFAIGDVTDLKEVKKAIYANNHVPVAAKNIAALLSKRKPKAIYKPKTDDEMMLVTLGRTGGVGYMPGLGVIKANWLIRMFKAGDMLTGMFRKSIGAPKAKS